MIIRFLTYVVGYFNLLKICIAVINHNSKIFEPTCYRKPETYISVFCIHSSANFKFLSLICQTMHKGTVYVYKTIDILQCTNVMKTTTLAFFCDLWMRLTQQTGRLHGNQALSSLPTW